MTTNKEEIDIEHQNTRKESDGVDDLLNRFGRPAAFWKAYVMPFR